MNILAGTCPGMFANATGEVYTTSVGERLNGYTAIANNGTTASRTYSITLMSMLGSLSSQYIPLFEMTSAPITLEIQLVDTILKALCPAAALASTGFTLNNVQFVGSFIELSDDSVSIIRQSLGGQPLQYVVQSYSNYPSSAALAVTPTQVSLPVPAKFASLRSLFCIMRSQSAGAATFFPLSSTHFNISDWKLRIGSQLVPYQSPTTMPEHFAELVKAIGSLSDANLEPSINMYNYSQDAAPVANAEAAGSIAATTRSSSFALGFDLESYANADKDKIFAGMNTINSDIFWNNNFGANTAVTVRFDFYALYDNVFIFENGVCRSMR